VLAFGAAPVETAVPAGPTRLGPANCGGHQEKNREISFRLHGRIDADLDLRCLGDLANC
jgi:hypothetical protein